MSRKQLLVLFLINVLPSLAGNALIPLLPIYVQRFSVDSGAVGVYLGCAFFGVATGATLSGMISRRWGQRRLMLMTAGFTCAISTVAMQAAPNFTLVTAATTLTWFSGGFIITNVSILAAMFASKRKRGKVFGVLGLSLGCAQISAGIIAGQIMRYGDFPALFGVIALLYLFVPVLALLVQDKPNPDMPAIQKHTSNPIETPLPPIFWMLFAASLVVYLVNFAAGLGRPLAMSDLGLSRTAISSTSIAGGMVTLTLPLMVGTLSDRIGRRGLMMACYMSVSMGAVVMAYASADWHFHLSTMLIAPIVAAFSMGNALATDLLPSEVLSTGLARYGTTPWIAGIIGFASTGVIVSAVGVTVTFTLGAFLPLVSIGLLWSLRHDLTIAPRMIFAPEGAD